MNFVLIFCNSTVSRLLYAHSHYNMCAGGGYMYQIMATLRASVVLTDIPVIDTDRNTSL